MATGDQVRDTAQKAVLQAKQHRDQANNVHKSAIDLERVATQLDNEATNLERQAKVSDDTEKRAQNIMCKFKNQSLQAIYNQLLSHHTLDSQTQLVHIRIRYIVSFSIAFILIRSFCLIRRVIGFVVFN